MSDKRYFRADDGATYSIVARDLDHAKRILDDAGIDFDSDADDVRWSEMTVEQAAAKRIVEDDAHNRITPYPLTEAEIGDWFSSEW